MRGVMRSLTNAVITTPKARPMTTAIARSTTLPRSRNALKPFTVFSPLRHRHDDFAELLRGIESLECGLHFIQREDLVNHRAQARVDRLQHRPELIRVAHGRAEHVQLAPEQPRHR